MFIVKKGIKELYQKGFEDPSFFHREIMQRDLHEGQERCLKGMRFKDSFIACGNRYGKGDIGLAALAYYGFYKPVEKRFKNKHIDLLNTSISQDQANIIFDKFQQNLVDVPTFSWMIEDIKKSPFPNITLKNDVTIWFRNASQNGKYLEGRSYFYINFDEADLQDNYLRFIKEILEPRVWDFGGFISHMTTPRRGKKNAFKLFDEMKKESERGNNNIYIHQGDSRENKFLHEKAILKMNKLPERLLNKNVKGLFTDSDGVINSELLDFAEQIAVGLKDSPEPGKKYVHAWDLARSSTYNCGATIEISENPEKPLQLVSYDRFCDHENKNRKYWQKVEKYIKLRQKKWGGITVIDKTGVGDVVYSYIEDINPIGIQLAEESGKLRQRIIDEGLSTFEMGGIGIPAKIEQVNNGELWLLRDELGDFDPESTKTIIWDFVCAIFLGIWIAKGNNFSNKEPKKAMPTISRVRSSSKYGGR